MTSMFEDWVASFRRDPNRAISDLFSGRAGPASTSRLGIPQILRQLFPAQRREDRQKLDDALLVWLLRMREEQAVQVDQLGKSVFAYELVEALDAILFVDLPHCREHIRAHLDSWLRWLTPLRVAPERDPALACWRVVTREQPSAEWAATWMRLAEDPRQEYFDVVWVGLKLLPNDGDTRQNQLLMMEATIRHASMGAFEDIDTAQTWCERFFAMLRVLFPNSPEHWRGVLIAVTDEIIERETGFITTFARRLRSSNRGSAS